MTANSLRTTYIPVYSTCAVGGDLIRDHDGRASRQDPKQGDTRTIGGGVTGEESRSPSVSAQPSSPSVSTHITAGHSEDVLPEHGVAALLARIDALIALQTAAALAKTQEPCPTSPPAPTPIAPLPCGDDASYMADVKSDELDHRISEMQQAGMKTTSAYERGAATLRRKELEFWRMKMALEEKQITSSCETFVTMAATALETACKALQIDVVCLDGLTAAVQQGVSEGAFTRPIEYYVKTMGGGTGLVSSPFYAFVSAFLAIVIKTHIRGKAQSHEHVNNSPDGHISPDISTPPRRNGRESSVVHKTPLGAEHLPRAPYAVPHTDYRYLDGKHGVSTSPLDAHIDVQTRVPVRTDDKHADRNIHADNEHTTRHAMSHSCRNESRVSPPHNGQCPTPYGEDSPREFIFPPEPPDQLGDIIRQISPALATLTNHQQLVDDTREHIQHINSQLPRPMDLNI